MKIDLHIHTKTCSDGNLPIEQVFEEAKARNIEFISITDHDSVDCQKTAIRLAHECGMSCVTGVELNVTFEHKQANGDTKSISLDFLGYGFDIENKELKDKLQLVKEHRETRARMILDNLNTEFKRRGLPTFTEDDLKKIEESVDGVFGRPHIADYLVKKGIVSSRQEAFDEYLVKCDVPKYPLSLSEASNLVRHAGGLLVLAHPNDPNGTSLVAITSDLDRQAGVIEAVMLPFIDGIECWHSRHDASTTEYYVRLAKRNHLLATGGSDCHQKPVTMGSLDIPDWVADQLSACLSKSGKYRKSGVKA